jgi:hypothetical protein
MKEEGLESRLDMDEDEDQDTMEEDTTGGGNLPNSGSNPLTGSHGEARQEQWVRWAGTAGDWGNPGQFKS